MQAVIIAAGESSRFWPLNQDHKSLTYLLGKPIIYWTIKGLVESGIKDIVVVCKKESQLPEILKQENDLGANLQFAFQEQPFGTGNALWQTRAFIKEPFFVVWPNKVTAKELATRMQEQKKAQGLNAMFVGAQTSTPWDYGVARFEGERIVAIEENPEPGKEPSQVKVIGFYLFEPDFFAYYEKLSSHHEADNIDAINLYLKDKKAQLLRIDKDVPTLKYPWELFGILDILFSLQGEKQMIAPSAKIGEGTVIQGSVYIGEDCEIGPHNVLRGPLSLERRVKTGAFCEIKHSIVQEGTHFHSGYIGDSIIGRNCRFGAGFISANRRFDRQNVQVKVQGKKVDAGTAYFGTVVGEGTHFGIHAGTMPGVLIGKECVVYPGSHVFENMPDNSLRKASA